MLSFGLPMVKMESSLIRWPTVLSPELIAGRMGGPSNFQLTNCGPKQICPHFSGETRFPSFPFIYPPYAPPTGIAHLSVPVPVSEPEVTETSKKSQESAKKKCSPGIFRPWADVKTEVSNKTSQETSLPSVSVQVSKPNLDSAPSKDKDRNKPARTSGTQNSAVETVHDQQQSALEMIATNLGKSSAGHRCIYCGKIYSRKYGLKIHLRTHTGFKPLKCRVCHRAFGDPSNLNKHTRLHAENGMTFKCQLCGKLLIRKRDLERHLASRHSGTPNGIQGLISPHFNETTSTIEIDRQTVISDFSDIDEREINVEA